MIIIEYTEQLALAAQSLIHWFAFHARKLPWREKEQACEWPFNFDNKSLYHALVSEFMLQQTRVETVIPYYNRWMSRWPDLASLANANEDEALKFWEGLGYYSRCRNLLKSARILHEHKASGIAITIETLRSCPGVGEYTAGAIASIGLGLSVPAVDGNAERVIGRFAALDLQTGSAALRREVTGLVTSMLEHAAKITGEFASGLVINQAVMDLGAMACTPKSPKCDACPWSDICQAHIIIPGHETDFPRPRVRPAISNDKAWGLILLREHKILLHRRPASGLWAGMWEIPWCDRTDADFESDFTAWLYKNLESKNEQPLQFIIEPQELGAVTFSFTTHRVRAWVVALDLTNANWIADFITGTRADEWRFVSREELDGITLPTPSRKFLDVLTKK